MKNRTKKTEQSMLKGEGKEKLRFNWLKENEIK